MPANRAKSGQFKKGQSGNPNGRPKVVEEFKARCRRFVDEHVLSAWESEVVERGPDWMKAAELLAAYGYGRPTQHLAGEDGAPLSVSINLGGGE